MGDEKATTTPAFSFSSSSDRKKRQSSKRRPHSWASLSSLPTPAISTGAGSRSSQSLSAFLLADDTSTFVNDVARVYGADTDPVTFEPVVDVPALWTTVVVLGGALLLRLRQSAIAEAAETRASALEHLRTAKAKELGNEASPGEVRRAVRSYRAALDEEAPADASPRNPAESSQQSAEVRTGSAGGRCSVSHGGFKSASPGRSHVTHPPSPRPPSPPALRRLELVQEARPGSRGLRAGAVPRARR